MEEANIFLFNIHCTVHVLPFLQVLLSTFSNLPKTGNFFPQLACSCKLFHLSHSCLCKCILLWLSSEAHFIVPDWEDYVGHCIGLSYRSVWLYRLAGRYDNPMPYSRLYPPVRDYEFGINRQILLILSKC